MLVAVVMAILMVATVPRFQQTVQRLRVEQTAFELAQLLRVARERAIAQGRTVAWVWDSGARRAQLEVEAPLGAGGGRAVMEGRFTHSRRVPPGMTIELSRDDAVVDDVRFFRDGTSEPTVVSVADQRSRYTIAVDGPTGHVQVTAGHPAR